MNLLFFCVLFYSAAGFTDDPESHVPDPPENVRGKAYQDSVTLWWDSPSSAPNPLVRGFTLSYGTENPNKKIVIATPHITAYTVSGLIPNTTYVFSLTAYNEAEGEDSERVLLSLTTLPLKPVSVSDLIEGPEIRVKVISPSEIKVKWSQPRVNVSQDEFKAIVYVVQYWNLNDQEEVRKLTTEALKASVSGLEPGQKYAVKVKAVFPGGRESQWSKVKIAATPSQVFPQNGYVEKCDFESAGQCDYVSEANAQFEWMRMPSGHGHSMLLDTTLGSSEDSNGFGRLISPVFQLKRSSHICSSLHYYITQGSKGLFKLSLLFEGQELDRALPLFEKSLADLPQGLWQKVVVESKAKEEKGFQLLLEGARSGKTGFKVNVDNVTVIAGQCPEQQRHFGNVTDDESEVNLLTPLENLLHSGSHVFRTKGLDGLPAVGVQKGAEIVVPYRIYLPRRFYRNFAILASIKPRDEKESYLFAVVNAFDTVVDVGLKWQPAPDSQTNISLIYTDSEYEATSSRVLASFLVPSFTNQWTQLALEVNEDNVILYFRCVRYASKSVRRNPEYLQMDDASKLYVANAGPILTGGFEGSIQELKIFDNPAEAANQCNDIWWKKKQKTLKEEGSGKLEPEENDSFAQSSNQATNPPTVSTTTKTPELVADYPMAPPMLKDGSPYLLEDDSLILPFVFNDRYSVLADPVQSYWSRGSESTSGPQGERGEPGIPGPPGLTGATGPMGPPGVCEQRCPLVERRLELTDAEVARIAMYPGVKGEKGERGKGSENRPLAPYHHSQYSVEPLTGAGEKGQKGDAGFPGPPGMPGIAGPRGLDGRQGPPGPPGRDGGSVGSQGGVRVYETAVELFSSSSVTPVGCLAFALSSQQLFIRVNNGWQGVKMDGFYPAIERKPSAPIYMANSPAKDHLSYWLENDGDSADRAPCARRSVSQPRDISHHSTPSPPLPYTRPLHPPSNHKHDQYKHAQKELQKDGTSPYQNTVDSRLTPHHGKQKLHLIALNELYRGDMRGIRGADLECYRQARRSGFRTTFRAFLSSKVQDLNKIVFFDDRRYPVVNVRGDLLFDSWEALFTGRSPQAAILGFNGIDHFSNRRESGIWHGSNAAGNRVSEAFCNGWRSERHSDYGMASFVGPQAAEIMVEPREVSCDKELIVLCVENMSAFSARRRVGKRISEDF